MPKRTLFCFLGGWNPRSLQSWPPQVCSSEPSYRFWQLVQEITQQEQLAQERSFNQLQLKVFIQQKLVSASKWNCLSDTHSHPQNRSNLVQGLPSVWWVLPESLGNKPILLKALVSWLVVQPLNRRASSNWDRLVLHDLSSITTQDRLVWERTIFHLFTVSGYFSATWHNQVH